MKTIFKIGSKSHTLKYQRKMPEGEVKKMKSFVGKAKMEVLPGFEPGSPDSESGVLTITP